jgi:hypothetical protein
MRRRHSRSPAPRFLCGDQESTDEHDFRGSNCVGSALVALWIAVRFPRLAPRSMIVRVVGASVGAQLPPFVPVTSDTYLALYCSVFVVVLPVLIAVWLHALWVLMGLRDLLASSQY